MHFIYILQDVHIKEKRVESMKLLGRVKDFFRRKKAYKTGFFRKVEILTLNQKKLHKNVFVKNRKGILCVENKDGGATCYPKNNIKEIKYEK